MSGTRTAVAVLAASVVAGGVLVHAAQQQPARGQAPAPAQAPSPAQPAVGQGQTPSQFPLSQTVRDRGSSITGSFEGWYNGKDGNLYALLGYFNRNTRQELDIPVGPNNRIDPGGPDQGQPTHFLTGRQRGIFTVKLPKDIATKKLVWTIVANGFTNAITLQTYPTYVIEPYMNSTTKAVPPVLKFDPNGPSFIGPPQAIAATYTTTMPAPLSLMTYVTTQATPGRGGGGGGGGGARGAPPATTTGAAGAAGAATSDEPAPAGAAAAAAPGGRGGRGAGGRGAGGRGGRGGGGAGGGAAAAAAGAGDPAQQPAGGAPGGGRAGRGAAGGPAGAAAALAGGFGGRGGGGAAWTKFRGPGTVTFTTVTPPPAANAAPAQQANAAPGAGTEVKTETTAAFDAPGDYILRFQAGNPNGEQCCWTNAHVKVTVKAAGSK